MPPHPGRQLELGREWGRWGEERPRQPHARWREGEMVTEANDEGVREKNPDHSPWRWGPGDPDGLDICQTLPHSPKCGH